MSNANQMPRYWPGVRSADLVHVDVRQEHIITQTITRPQTTMTVLVTLGTTETTSIATAAPFEPTTPPASPNPATAVPSSGSSLTSNQLGTIIGSVLGTALLLLLLAWFCISQNRRRQQISDNYSDIYSEESGTVISDSTAEMSERRRRSRGAGAWERLRRERLLQLQQQQQERPQKVQVGIPPPPRFPPTPQFNPYKIRHTPYPQIRGVQRYPG